MKRLMVFLMVFTIFILTGCDLLMDLWGGGDDPSPGPSPSPPPQPRLAFSSNRDGNLEIYAMNADGSDVVNLSGNPATDMSPDWSPDGSQIAFISYRDGSSEVYVMDADGSDQTRLTDNGLSDKEPQWSPDGSRIAFISDDQVTVINADGTGLAALTAMSGSTSRVNWSPDGTRLAFSSVDTDWEVFVIDADGQNLTNVSNGKGLGTDTRPCWSPDGSRIVFTSARTVPNWDLYLVDPDGGNLTPLTDDDGGSYGIWSPLNDYIAYQKGDLIKLVQPDGLNLQVITNYDFGGSSSEYVQKWSPDGTMIAFTPYDHGPFASPHMQMYIIKRDGSEYFILETEWDDKEPDWRP